MCVNNLPKVATQWNSGATRDSNRGRRVLEAFLILNYGGGGGTIIQSETRQTTLVRAC